jgi:type IV secretory pathway VirB10-like protein
MCSEALRDFNACLTASGYHLNMQYQSQSSAQARTGSRAGIWLALAVALGLHAIFLFLPVNRQAGDVGITSSQIEVQLRTTLPPVPAPPPEQKPETVLPAPEPITETKESLAVKPAEIAVSETTASPLTKEIEPVLERVPLTSTILARQFITEPSAADRIFGKPLEKQDSENKKEFHYPIRQNMLSMLNQPMPELPFAYTPGLVRFSYEPGVKGDLQRFWDVITPEFGWRTKNGTEFKCIWILVIGGCGWK